VIVGIRGATTVEDACRDAILRETRALLDSMLRENGLSPDRVACAFFTMTHDLDSEYPARAAREGGWSLVPLFCAQEPRVRGALERCIRVLLLCECDIPRDAVRHVYLGRARSLRPDLAESSQTSGGSDARAGSGGTARTSSGEGSDAP